MQHINALRGRIAIDTKAGRGKVFLCSGRTIYRFVGPHKCVINKHTE